MPNNKSVIHDEEVVDHVIVLNEDQLRRRLGDYVSYYNVKRVHTSLRDEKE
ncbi:MAG: hypothetical protein IH973_05905 [Myxococcales bacterium]|nr:hypothetical protein [Myxococcales bacterium]